MEMITYELKQTIDNLRRSKMQKTATVISVEVDVDVPTKAGGTYNCTVFKYNDGYDQERKLPTNYTDESLQKTIHSLVAGDLINVDVEKVNGFLKVVGVTPASGKEKAAPAQKARPAKAAGFSSDARQDSIVFQNAMAHAVNLAGGKSELQDIIHLAKTIAIVSRNPKLDEFEASLKKKVAAGKETKPAPVAKKKDTTTEVVDDDVEFGD